MYRTILVILSGNSSEALLSLLRNLLIAKLIPVEDYGIAATFAMAMSIVEMASGLGMQQQIVQAKNGEDPRFQAGLQGFNLVRGIMSGAILFFAAGWIAAFLQVPEVAWAYQMLAVVPILNGLQHFDVHRLKRGMRHGPDILTRTLSSAAALALVWPLSLWIPDYRIMLVAILVQFSTVLLISHSMAERPFRLSFDREVIGAALHFGWPLLVNNILLFLVYNGEKLIVGRELGMQALGILAMGFTLTLTPTLVLGRTAQNFFLPQLSAVQSEHDRFTELAIVTFQAVTAATLVFLGCVVFLGGPFVAFALGEKYTELVPLMPWLAILQTMRVLKTGGTVVALAKGYTSNAMWANMARLLAIPVAWAAAISGVELLTIVWIAIGGEVLALIMSLIMLRWRIRLPFSALALPLGMTLMLVTVAIWIAWPYSQQMVFTWPSIAEVLAFLTIFTVAMCTMRPLWFYLFGRQGIGAEE